MLNRPLQSRSFNHAVDDDFWASGIMLMAGVAACAAYILVCVVSLANPDTGDDLRASVTVGPVRVVAIGDVVGSVAPAAVSAARPPAIAVAAAGVSSGCKKNVLSSHL